MKLRGADIAGLGCPAGQAEKIHWDDEITGFGLRCRVSGARTWIAVFRTGHQQKRVSLGSPSVVDEPLARAKAKKILAKVVLGEDPAADRAAERLKAMFTIAALSEQFLAFKTEKKKRRPGSLAAMKLHLKEHWAPLAGMPIDKVELRHVAARLTEIAASRGPYAANRSRATLSSFFKWCMGQGLVGANPTVAALKQVDEEPRSRVLSDDELIAVWRACEGDDDFSRAIRLLFLTGARRDEVGGMLKSELTIGSRLWLLPPGRTKNKRQHEIPLSDLALTIIKAAMLRPDRLGQDRVFATVPWAKAKKRLDDRIEPRLKPWRIHDLRRTCSTRMADIAIQPHIIEAVLNHISGHKGGVAGTYNWSTYTNEKRAAIDRLAAHVEAIIAGRPGSNVLPLTAPGAAS
jgi:integrase